MYTEKYTRRKGSVYFSDAHHSVPSQQATFVACVRNRSLGAYIFDLLGENMREVVQECESILSALREENSRNSGTSW